MTKTYAIGTSSFKVGPTGYGLMGFTWTIGHRVPEEQYNECLNTALADGVSFWNSGDFYGRPNPEDNILLLAKYFKDHPEAASKVYLSVKGGVEPTTWMTDGSPESIERSLNTIHKVLGAVKPLDMFTLARLGSTPIEEVMAVMKKGVENGLVKDICLSEVSADSIRRAHKVHPVSAVEIEFSLFSREAESNGVFDACKELGIPIISYSPLGKGLLTGTVSLNELPENDMRRHFDRFQPEHFDTNQVLVQKVSQLAKKKNATPGQIALSWIRTLSGTGKYPVIIPIPGSTNPKRVHENSTHINLTQEDMNEINQYLSGFKTSGYRYNAQIDAHTYR